MASRETRAFVAAQGDFYLCPLPALQLAKAELDEAIRRFSSGDKRFSPVLRAPRWSARADWRGLWLPGADAPGRPASARAGRGAAGGG